MLLPELLVFGLVACSLVDSYDSGVNYWDAFAPGQLLERLKALTDVDQSKVGKLPEIMPVLTVTQALPKADEYLDGDVDVDADTEAENDEVDSMSHEGYSGERNYEQFVKEYFDRAAAGANSNDVLELEEEETQAAEPTNIKDHHCRRVKRKDGKLCEICRQLKNNEVSETCSYSQDDRPEQYAYGRGIEYKHSRTDPQKRKKKNSSKPTPVASSSLCLRQQQENRVCYECKDSNGQNIGRCYDVPTRKATTKTSKMKTSSHKRKPRSQQAVQEQSIYKSTSTYSYIPL